MTTKKAVDVGAIALRATAHPAPPPQPHARPIKDAMATDPHVRMEIVRSAHGQEVIAHQVIGRHAVMATVPLPRAVTDPLTATGQPAPMASVRSAQGPQVIVRTVIAYQVIGPHAVMETVPLPRAVTDPLTATGQPAPMASVRSAQGPREIVRTVIGLMVIGRLGAMATVPRHRVASVRLSGRVHRAARALPPHGHVSRTAAVVKPARAVKNGKTVVPPRDRVSRTALPK